VFLVVLQAKRLETFDDYPTSMHHLSYFS